MTVTFILFVIIGLLFGGYLALGAAIAATTPPQDDLAAQLKAIMYHVLFWPKILLRRRKK